MGYIGNTPADKYQTLQKQSFITSATTSYTLSYSVTNPQDIALFINNVRQNPNSSYTVSGTTLTLSSATTGTLTMADTCAGDEGEGEGEADPNISCSTSTILSTGYTDPEFFTHVFDPGIIRSVKVINPHDPNGRFLRITIDPHVCDVDTIIETFCLCTSYDAFGDTIVEFGEMTVTKVDDYTIDVVITGQIIETQGYEG